MSDIPPITHARKFASDFAGNAYFRAFHQLFTVLGIPALLLVSNLGYQELDTIKKDISTIKSDVAVLKTLDSRIQSVEAWREATAEDIRRRPRFDLSDGRELEDRVRKEIIERFADATSRIVRVEDRVTVLERSR